MLLSTTDYFIKFFNSKELQYKNNLLLLFFQFKSSQGFCLIFNLNGLFNKVAYDLQILQIHLLKTSEKEVKLKLEENLKNSDPKLPEKLESIKKEKENLEVKLFLSISGVKQHRSYVFNTQFIIFKMFR